MGKERKNLLKVVRKPLWFLFWVLTYSVLYIIFTTLLSEGLGEYNFYSIRIIHLLILGLCFSIASRIIYCLIHQRTINMSQDVFLFWTLAYGLLLGLLEFLHNFLAQKLIFLFLSNYYTKAIFIGVGIHLSICIIKRMEFSNFNSGRSRFLRAPSQIFTGVTLIVLGVLCWRFSTMVFIDWLRWYEGLLWAGWIGLGLIVAGFLTLLAWWRNNVLQHRIGVKFGHW